MKTQYSFAASVFVGLVALAGSAAAAGRDVVLEDPGPKTCVPKKDLVQALARAGIEVGESTSIDRTTIAVEGDPKELRVSIHGGGFDASQTLAATCETASDVVAAFVTSALAPAPDIGLALPEGPPLDAARLTALLKNELARQEIRLAPVRAAFVVSRDSKEWRAEISKKGEPGCRRMVSLGDFDEASPENVATAAYAISRVLRDFEDCPKGARHLSTRAAHLESALHDAIDYEPPLVSKPWWLITEGAIATTAFTVLAAYHPFEKSDALAIGGGGILLGGGIASGLANEDHRLPIARVALLGGLGTLLLADAASEFPMMEPTSSIPLASGSYASMALVGAAAAIRRPPIGRLRMDHGQVATAAERDEIPLREVERIEKDLSDLDPPIPDWVTYSPLLAGGLVAMSFPVAHGLSERHDVSGFLYGLGMATMGAVSMIHHSYFREYRESLRKAGFENVAIGPGPADRAGISISGRF